MTSDEVSKNPRAIVVQKLYSYFLNKEEKIIYPKHQYKKFIKDIVAGTIERGEIISEFMDNELKNDFNEKRTEILIKIILEAAIFEFMYKLNIPTKVIINEYLNVSKIFLQNVQKNYLNAILDKISKKIRIKNE